jgi:hypothetical protein
VITLEIVNDLKKQIKENWEGYNTEKNPITLKILYSMSRNSIIEKKKEELIILFQSALDNFKNSPIGSKYDKDGWLDEKYIKDGLHNIILNSSTCKKLDEIFDDYTLDYIVFFSECCDDYSSPMYSAITAYQYLCQIEEEEKKKIDNNVLMLENILGQYISKQVQAFHSEDDGYIYDNRRAEAYRKLWYTAKSNAIKFYNDKCSTGRKDYKNIRIILDTIDEVFNYYVYGPKKIDIGKASKTKALQKKANSN